MGNSCSASLGHPEVSESGQTAILHPHSQLHPVFLAGAGRCGECEADECGPLCPDNSQPNLLIQSSEHPLLKSNLSSAPRTPRGPAPPWAAVQRTAPVDRTATGATPPRSPTPPRVTPPGLPEEDGRNSMSLLVLTQTLDSQCMQELFGAARSGNAMLLSVLLQKVNGVALGMATANVFDKTSNGSPTAEQCQKAADLVAALLTKARDVGNASRDNLLGVAAFGGHVESCVILLGARADPTAVDSLGCTALHRAAEGGSLLTVLAIMDRLQSNQRSLTVSELASSDGESPEMLAALAGASDICRAFEVFRDMQAEAEKRQLGSMPDLAAAGGSRGRTGRAVAVLDLSEPPGAAGAAGGATELLRRAAAGTQLVPDIFERIPEDSAALQRFLEKAANGVLCAEEYLLSTDWNTNDAGLDSSVRSFVSTVDLRATWQKIRIEAVRSEGAAVPGSTASSNNWLEEFWQTHLTAETMVATLRSATGDTFQLLLTVLWLYTRESWLRHVVDTLAATLALAGPSSSSGEGATGGTTGATADSQRLPSQFDIVAPFLEHLGPIMRLVQCALAWFEEAGIRHTAPTYRPLSLPMLGLQRLVDRFLTRRKGQDAETESQTQRMQSLTNGVWLSMGSGTFFSSAASKADAIKRLIRTHSNVLLVLRPDEHSPSYPKHMTLRGSSVDDTLFPLETIFRITHITRSVSSELDPEGASSASSLSKTRWPVMVIELAATARSSEALDLLDQRGALGPGELELRLRSWTSAAARDHEPQRLYEAAEILSKASGAQSSEGSQNSKALSNTRISQALAMLKEASIAAEAASGGGDTASGQLAAKALLLKARLSPASRDEDCKKAVSLLAGSLGKSHALTMEAVLTARSLGVTVQV